MKLHAYVTSVLLLGATLYPALQDARADGFPLSTYPMFARAKPDRVAVMSALAIGDAGFELVLEPSYIANAEAMQALQTLKKSVAAGRSASRGLCKRIAERVAERIAQHDQHELAGTRFVEIVTQQHDAVRYLSGEKEPLERKVHMRCAVPSRLKVGP